MAANIWDNSTADGLANTAANWSLGNVPTGTDVATFADATSATNCLFDVSISCAGIDVQSTYSGDIDMATYNLTTTGDMTFDGSGIFDCGTGTLTCSGNFDNKDQTTWTRGTSTIKLDGTAKTLISNQIKDLRNLTIVAGATITLDAATVGWCDVAGAILVEATATFTIEDRLVARGQLTVNGTINYNTGINDTNGHVNVGAAGVVGGTGRITLQANNTLTNLGTWSVANTTLSVSSGTYTIVGGTFGGSWSISGTQTRTLRFSANTVFTGDVQFETTAGGVTFTIDPATSDVDIEFRGDLDFTETAGTVVWSKAATGLVTFAKSSGSQVYTDSTAAIQDLGLVVHNDAGGTGTLQLATEMECTTFDGDDGSFDPNGQTLDCSGNVDWDLGWDFIGDADTFNGCTWLVGGDFTAEAQTCKATAGWTLTVTGTAVALGAGAVAYSNAGGGTEITASAGPWTDNLNNTNWDFGAAVGNPWNAYAQQAG